MCNEGILTFLFDLNSDMIKKVLTWIEDALTWLPWPVLIATVALWRGEWPALRRPF